MSTKAMARPAYFASRKVIRPTGFDNTVSADPGVYLSPPLALLKVRLDAGKLTLALQISRSGASATKFEPGVKLDIRMADGSILSLQTVTVSSPSSEATANAYSASIDTYWELDFPLDKESAQKLGASPPAAIQLVLPPDTDSWALADSQQEFITKVLACFAAKVP
jgi:hypothetical protein